MEPDNHYCMNNKQPFDLVLIQFNALPTLILGFSSICFDINQLAASSLLSVVLPCNSIFCMSVCYIAYSY